MLKGAYTKHVATSCNIDRLGKKGLAMPNSSRSVKHMCAQDRPHRQTGRQARQALTYDTLIQAHTQRLQSIDEALLGGHGLVAEAADVVLVQGQHCHPLADAACQLHPNHTTVNHKQGRLRITCRSNCSDPALVAAVSSMTAASLVFFMALNSDSGWCVG